MELSLKEFQSDKELVRTLFNNFGYVLVFLFHSPSIQPSQLLKDNFSSTLNFFGQHENVKYFSLNAEKCPETFKKFGVEYTPTVLFTQTDKKILVKHETEDVGIIFDSLASVAAVHKQDFNKNKIIWHAKIKSILESCQVIVFIKGTPDNPKCGFTETLLELLKVNNIEYTYYDIIEDEYMRYWLRNYSGWATYPQVYLSGKIVGGLDAFKEQLANGDLLKKLPSSSKAFIAIQDKYKLLVEENPNIIFTDGFAFENKEIEQYIASVKEKNSLKDVTICNIALNQKLSAYLKEQLQAKLPFYLQNGKPA